MLNRRARAIIGYDNLVKRLAGEMTEEEMEYVETGDMKKRLGEGYEKWEFKDWYRLICDIKKEQMKDLHTSMTADCIFGAIPWACQQSAQEMVRFLIKKADMELLFKLDKGVDVAVNALWNMFYCMGIDIKYTALKMCSERLFYSKNDLDDNKLLYDFIVRLRDIQWKQGEVTRLRTKKRA